MWGFLILRPAYSLRSFDFIDNEVKIKQAKIPQTSTIQQANSLKLVIDIFPHRTLVGYWIPSLFHPHPTQGRPAALST